MAEIRILHDHSAECREAQRRNKWQQGWMLNEEAVWRDIAGTRRGSSYRWLVLLKRPFHFFLNYFLRL
jgi:hypothetical protein